MALPDNVFAYYKLNGDATDATGVSNGVATGVSWNAAKIGTGAKFAGTTSSNIQITNTLPTLGNLSISFWVKPTNLASTEKYFVRDESGGTNWGWMLSQDSTNVYQVGVQTTVAWRTVNSTVAVQTSNFVHLVMTYNTTTLLLYVNGVQDATLSVGEGTKSTANKDIFIGCLNTTTQTSAALIDEVSIWNAALTAKQVAELYNDSIGITYPFLSVMMTNRYAVQGFS